MVNELQESRPGDRDVGYGPVTVTQGIRVWLSMTGNREQGAEALLESRLPGALRYAWEWRTRVTVV